MAVAGQGPWPSPPQNVGANRGDTASVGLCAVCGHGLCGVPTGTGTRTSVVLHPTAAMTVSTLHSELCLELGPGPSWAGCGLHGNGLAHLAQALCSLPPINRGSQNPSQLHPPEGLQQDAELLGTSQRKHRDEHLRRDSESGSAGAPPLLPTRLGPTSEYSKWVDVHVPAPCGRLLKQCWEDQPCQQL